MSTTLLSDEIPLSQLQLLRLFTQNSTFDWNDVIIDLAKNCKELNDLDARMGGGFIPSINTNHMTQLQKDFITVFSHIEDYSQELLNSLIHTFMAAKDGML